MMADPFEGRLLDRETILWFDRPQQGLMLMPRDGLLIPFSLVWGGFALFWEATVLGSPHAPWPMMLCGIPFVLIGLFMIVGRFPLDAWLRARTIYALTNRRVLIARSGPWPSFKALSLDRLPEATLREEANGRGTIRIGSPTPFFGSAAGGSFGFWIAALDPSPQFLSIEDARRVFNKLQELTQRTAD